MRRTDGTVVIDMPWRGLTRFEYRNSALPPARRAFISPTNPGRAPAAMALKKAHTVMGWGIVGQGTVAPLPGANVAQLRVHDRLGGSDLVGGRAHRSPQCLIFPGEFEANWQQGTVGAWLRVSDSVQPVHSWKDIQITDGRFACSSDLAIAGTIVGGSAIREAVAEQNFRKPRLDIP